MNLSDRNYASLFLDGAAIFLLIGMIIHTTIYRRRGRINDRLFFSMLITDILMACSDMAVAIANGESFAGARVMNLLGESLYYITMGVFAFLVVLFLYYRLAEDEKRYKKMRTILMIPITLVELMYLIGVPNGLFISVDADNNYHFAKLYFLPVAIMGLYVIAALYLSLIYKAKMGKVKHIPLWIYLIPMVGIYLPFFVEMAAMTPMMIAVCIAYMHMGIMNEQFFSLEEKTAEGDSPKGGARS